MKRNYQMLCYLLAGILVLSGCDAFVRKFTRKPKKDDVNPSQVVVYPHEYTPPQMSKEERYRNSTMYWKAWQDELLNALADNRSQKKKLDCIEQALKNLQEMRAMLNIQKQKELDRLIERMLTVQSRIKSDPYGRDDRFNRIQSENLKRDILQHFSYFDVKESLI